MGVTFKWNGGRKAVVNRVLGGDKTALFAASEVRRLSNEYVPYLTGYLARDTVDVYVENGEGVVHYKAPYAKCMYYGTKLRFNKSSHKHATAFWDKAMLQARRGELIAAIQAYIDRGAK